VRGEDRIASDPPLRQIQLLVNDALKALDACFSGLYAQDTARPSITPERLLRAMQLQAIYSIRPERQLMERIEFDLLFRWLAGLGPDEPTGTPRRFQRTVTAFWTGILPQSSSTPSCRSGARRSCCRASTSARMAS
jgi:hypothetical protein